MEVLEEIALFCLCARCCSRRRPALGEGNPEVEEGMIQQGLAQARAQLESRRKNCIVQLRELTAAAQAGSLSPAQLEASREKLIANHKAYLENAREVVQGRLEAKEITQHVHSRFVYEISSSERAFQVAVTSGESEQHHASMRVQRLQQEPVRPRSVTRQQAQRQAQRRIQSQAQTDVVVSSSSSPARTPVPSAPPLDDSDLQTTDENTPIVAASTDL